MYDRRGVGEKKGTGFTVSLCVEGATCTFISYYNFNNVLVSSIPKYKGKEKNITDTMGVLEMFSHLSFAAVRLTH